VYGVLARAGKKVLQCCPSTSGGGIAQGFDFSLSDLSARFLTARNCMSLILKMKTITESGLWVDQKITPIY
jgi:hypothetical protein